MSVLEIEKLEDGRLLVAHLDRGDTRKGSGWAKVVEGIDSSKTNGYAFQGEWLSRGDFVEPGSVVAVCRADGSWRHPNSTLYLLRITEDGNVEKLGEWNFWSRVEKVRAIQEIAKVLEQLKVQEKSREEQILEDIRKIAQKYGVTVEEIKDILNAL